VLGIEPGYTEQQERDRMIPALRDALSAAELANQLPCGAAMTEDQACEIALEI
jgi:hypothetical protein